MTVNDAAIIVSAVATTINPAPRTVAPAPATSAPAPNTVKLPPNFKSADEDSEPYCATAGSTVPTVVNAFAAICAPAPISANPAPTRATAAPTMSTAAPNAIIPNAPAVSIGPK